MQLGHFNSGFPAVLFCRKLALRYHPDKASDPTQRAAAEPAFKMITAAYTVLSDQDKRAAYDGARLISTSYRRSSRSGGAQSSNSSNSNSSADTTGSAGVAGGHYDAQFQPSFRFGGGNVFSGSGGYGGYSNAGFPHYRRSGNEHLFNASRH